jgi:biopolymer transport protein ExbB/TolQ
MNGVQRLSAFCFLKPLMAAVSIQGVLMKLFASSLVLSSLLMTGTAFAQEETTTKEQVQEIKKENQDVKEAKAKLAQDKAEGASKEQIKIDRKALKKARRARHEMKSKMEAEKQ